MPLSASHHEAEADYLGSSSLGHPIIELFIFIHRKEDVNPKANFFFGLNILVSKKECLGNPKFKREVNKI
jgi:hypothetical protein